LPMAREKKLQLTAMYEEGTGRTAGPRMKFSLAC
jgi:hypothetical protein